MSLINQVLQDLEKRHASESELTSLPPSVRAVPGLAQSPVRAYVVTAIILVMLAFLGAVAFFMFDGGRSLHHELAPVLSKPAAVPATPPLPEPKPPVALPVAELPPIPVFSPVSRLSDELSFVAPRSVPKESTAPVRSNPKLRESKVQPEASPPARPKAQVPKAPAVATLPKADAPAAKAPGVAERDIAPAASAPAAERDITPSAPAPVAADDGSPPAIDKQMRDVSASERAEIAFRKGALQLQDGRVHAAELDFREALKQDPTHAGARQALLGLLLDSGRNNEAEQFLRKALQINPRQPRHAMVLARLEVERGDVAEAINTMVGVLPYVQSDPDFYAFLAALLQREGRHREAVDYYRTALRGVPGNGVWMMGLGISLRAANQAAEARDAFQRAIESRQLAPELQEFVERQLREIAAAKKK